MSWIYTRWNITSNPFWQKLMVLSSHVFCIERSYYRNKTCQTIQNNSIILTHISILQITKLLFRRPQDLFHLSSVSNTTNWNQRQIHGMDQKGKKIFLLVPSPGAKRNPGSIPYNYLFPSHQSREITTISPSVEPIWTNHTHTSMFTRCLSHNGCGSLGTLPSLDLRYVCTNWYSLNNTSSGQNSSESNLSFPTTIAKLSNKRFSFILFFRHVCFNFRGFFWQI